MSGVYAVRRIMSRGGCTVSFGAVAAGVAALFLATWVYGTWSRQWDTDLTDSVYLQLVPHANEFGHP
jgi:hypothetical protein